MVGSVDPEILRYVTFSAPQFLEVAGELEKRKKSVYSEKFAAWMGAPVDGVFPTAIFSNCDLVTGGVLKTYQSAGDMTSGVGVMGWVDDEKSTRKMKSFVLVDKDRTIRGLGRLVKGVPFVGDYEIVHKLGSVPATGDQPRVWQGYINIGAESINSIEVVGIDEKETHFCVLGTHPPG